MRTFSSLRVLLVLTALVGGTFAAALTECSPPPIGWQGSGRMQTLPPIEMDAGTGVGATGTGDATIDDTGATIPLDTGADDDTGASKDSGASKDAGDDAEGDAADDAKKKDAKAH